jgi:hypothetical protein
MSSDPPGGPQKTGGTGYNPAGRTRKYSLAEMEAINRFIQGFESPWIKWAIYAAGFAAVGDLLHLIWLAARFLVGF